MSERVMTTAMRHLRRVALLHDSATLSDAQLLDRYVHDRDEAAFAALVRRHGPMVWGVCRRIIPSHHDAEDAFQATFLVLINKAAGISPRDMVANWLHGVACHTAIKARSLAARRRSREQCRPKLPEPAVMDAALDNHADLRRVIDRELGRLPDKYRVPIVLCDLSGTSYKDAARQIGCPAGTLAARLSRARALLAKRLARRGVTASATAIGVALASSAEAVPGRLLSSTVQTAFLMAAGQVAAGVIPCQVALLTKGVLHAMLWNKLKIGIVALLALGMFGTGAGLARYSVFGAEPKDAKKEKPAQTTPAQDLDQVEKLLEQARLILRKQREINDRNPELERFRELFRNVQIKKEIQAEAERKLLELEEARRIDQSVQDKIELEKLLKRLEEIVQRQQEQAQIDRVVARLNGIVKKLQAKQDKKSPNKGKDAETLQQFLGIYRRIDAKSAKDESEAIKLLEEFVKEKDSAIDEIKRLKEKDSASDAIKRLEIWLKGRQQAEKASDDSQRRQIVEDLNRLIQQKRAKPGPSPSEKPK